MTIDNTIDSATGTIKLKATFPNAASRLWPGQFVNTRVLVGTDVNVLTVPSAAVEHGQDRLYVFVLNPDQTVTARTVQITHDDGAVTVISAGLEEGQKVVIDGQSRLQDGSHVTLIAAAPKPAAKAGG